MNKEIIREFLKESLEIRVSNYSAKSGDGQWKDIELVLDGEVISSETIDTEDV